MTYEELKTNQQEVLKLLQTAKKRDKLVHAYLFEGDSGTGTLEAAKYFAMMLLCESETPCLKCNICERIEYNSHMNVVLIEPIGDVIRKEQVENLMHDFSMTSLEKGPQIYIIKDADKMNSSAANALLKFLEEPAKDHYAILLTNNHKRLLDTIVSRTQYIHFKPVSKTFIVDQLTNMGVDKDAAYVISHITADFGEAKKFIEETFGKEYVGRAYAPKGGANVQDAHEAIRPTDITLTPSSIKEFLTPDQYKLYSLIYSRALASIMTGEEVKVLTDAINATFTA